MNLDLRPFLYLWIAVALAVMVLIVRRKMVASHEDDNLHVLSGAAVDQTGVARKLDQIDKWGKLLTIVAVVYGVILGGLFMYQSWIHATNQGL